MRTSAADPVADLLRHLLLDAPAPLGPVRLATPWRDGLQWRRADEPIDRLGVHLDHNAPPATVRAQAHLEPDER